MPALLVTYDLKDPGRDYAGVYKVLKGYGTWWHHLESTWFIVTEDSPEELYERLRPHLDENDSLLVMPVHKEQMQGWLTEKAWRWLKKHLR